jgi:phage-related protein
MKPLHWIGSSLKDVKNFPAEVRREVGFALYLAQKGDKAANAVPMVGFGGANILEVVICEEGDAYRAIYTVKFAGAIYALHAFQKKSPRGAQTPRPDLNTLRERLKQALAHHDEKYGRQRQKGKANERGAS